MVRETKRSPQFRVSPELKLFDKRRAELLEAFAGSHAGWTVGSRMVIGMLEDVRNAISIYASRVHHQISKETSASEVRDLSRQIATALLTAANSIKESRPVHKARLRRLATKLRLAAVLGGSPEVPFSWQGPNGALTAMEDSMRHLASLLTPPDLDGKRPRIESGLLLEMRFGRPSVECERMLVRELATIWAQRTGRLFDTSKRASSDAPLTAMKFVETICRGVPVKLKPQTIRTLVTDITAERRQQIASDVVKKKSLEKVANS